jgi:ABC-type bacteriocin/lantibiotic exporter with double-glycine peptidase domain
MLRAVKTLVLVMCLVAVLRAASPGVWLDVPFVAQAKNGCGAASVAMLIGYWQQQKGTTASSDAAQIQSALYSRKADGIHASDLERYLRDHGFRVFTFAGQWSELKQHLEKGRPLLIALKPAGQSELHYVVIVGMDESAGIVLLNDPAERKLLKRERSLFEKEWKGAGNWMLLAVPEP